MLIIKHSLGFNSAKQFAGLKHSVALAQCHKLPSSGYPSKFNSKVKPCNAQRYYGDLGLFLQPQDLDTLQLQSPPPLFTKAFYSQMWGHLLGSSSMSWNRISTAANLLWKSWKTKEKSAEMTQSKAKPQPSWNSMVRSWEGCA